MKKIYKLEGLDCPHCSAKIEEGIKKLEGVKEASLSLMTTRLILEVAEEKLQEVEDGVIAITNKFEPDVKVVKVR